MLQPAPPRPRLALPAPLPFPRPFQPGIPLLPGPPLPAAEYRLTVPTPKPRGRGVRAQSSVDSSRQGRSQHSAPNPEPPPSFVCGPPWLALAKPGPRPGSTPAASTASSQHTAPRLASGLLVLASPLTARSCALARYAVFPVCSLRSHRPTRSASSAPRKSECRLAGLAGLAALLSKRHYHMPPWNEVPSC